jgi:hypothetical protein
MSSHLYQTLSAKNIDPNIIKLLFLKLEKNLKILSEQWIILDTVEIEFHSTLIDFKLNFLSEIEIQSLTTSLYFNDSYEMFRAANFRSTPEEWYSFFSDLDDFIFTPYVPLIVYDIFIFTPSAKEQITLSELFGTLKLFTK